MLTSYDYLKQMSSEQIDDWLSRAGQSFNEGFAKGQHIALWEECEDYSQHDDQSICNRMFAEFHAKHLDLDDAYLHGVWAGIVLFG